MNRQIRTLGIGLMVLFVALFIQLNVVQVVRADRYDADPGNNRTVVRDFTRPRGSIVTADGAVMAESVPTGDRYRYQRRYPTGELFANVSGYFSFTLGSTQLERTQNATLSGTTSRLELQGLGNLFNDQVNTGDVVTTLRADLQQVAKDALGDRDGSVVLLDPHTGAIKALWSFPSYDPNLIASHDFEAAKAAKTFYDAFPGKPLLANSYQERYLPGSTFKVITATAALESGKYTLDSYFPPVESYLPPQTTKPIHNYGGSTCGGTFVEVFRRSCNTAFAEMAVNVGAPDMVATAERYGFNFAPPFDLPRPAKSVFGTVADFVNNIPLLAIAGFGQGNTQATPLEMALVASAVANGGEIMTPYVRRQDDRPAGPHAHPDHAVTVAEGDGARRPPRPCATSWSRSSTTERPSAACSWPAASRPRPRPAPRSSTPRASRRPATRGSSPSHRPRSPATPSPSWSRRRRR